MPDHTARTTKTATTPTTPEAARANLVQHSPGTPGSARRGEWRPAVPGSRVTEAELVRQLQPVVKDTPGVASLVPSAKTALDRLRLSRVASRSASRADAGSANSVGTGRADQAEPDTSGDGITVTLDGDTVAAVLDITVTATASVLATALAVHSAAAQVLRRTYPGRHTVTVNVLGFDPVDSHS